MQQELDTSARLPDIERAVFEHVAQTFRRQDGPARNSVEQNHLQIEGDLPERDLRRIAPDFSCNEIQPFLMPVVELFLRVSHRCMHKCSEEPLVFVARLDDYGYVDVAGGDGGAVSLRSEHADPPNSVGKAFLFEHVHDKIDERVYRINLLRQPVLVHFCHNLFPYSAQFVLDGGQKGADIPDWTVVASNKV